MHIIYDVYVAVGRRWEVPVARIKKKQVPSRISHRRYQNIESSLIVVTDEEERM